MAKAFSIEDGNLSSSIVSSRSVSHVDVDLAFKPRPSGEIFKKTDAAAVKQAVKNLLMTSRHEKPFQPNFGANLNSALFALDTEYDPEYISGLIKDAITNYEPRARVLSLAIKPDSNYNALDVQITFQVVNTTEIVSLDLTIARLR
jgi:phage baseplate assembly protein W|tara:strand:+ start:41 stop:478 length:438 start_codon:yes stop_codon:yes gene_type:complete